MRDLHVVPVEKGITDEHERIGPNLESLKLCTKVDHHHPVQTKGNGNKSNRQILDVLGSAQDGDDHYEEQQGCSSNGILHEPNHGQDWVPLPNSHVCQHTDFICNETQEPSSALLD